MGLPNMAKVIKRKEQDISISVVTQTIVGVKPVETEVENVTKGCVQVASNEILKSLNLDYSKSYYQVHVRYSLMQDLLIDLKTIDKLTSYKGLPKEFKIIQLRNFSEYGYIEFICEEI